MAQSQSQLAERATSRRGALKLMGRVGITVVGGIAGLVATQAPAEADNICNWYFCCCLKHPNGGCPGSGANFTCPQGYKKKVWFCLHSNGIGYGCGECTTGDTCHEGKWKCSEGWRAGFV